MDGSWGTPSVGVRCRFASTSLMEVRFGNQAESRLRISPEEWVGVDRTNRCGLSGIRLRVTNHPEHVLHAQRGR